MRDEAGAADPLITGAEIARIAGVTRAAVSNWRRRHTDFPAPAGGSPGTPLFSLADVRTWLATQRKSHDVSDEVRLWQALRASFGDDMIGGLASVAEFLSTGNPSSLDSAAAALVTSLAKNASTAHAVDGLVERFQDSARRSGSDQVSSARVTRAVVHFAGRVTDGATVFDPACGIGVLLMAVGDADGTVVRGQEIDPAAARFAGLRAELTGRTDAVIQAGDSLRADAWPSLRADLVVCEPPASGPDWGREELLLDARWELGTPSKAEGELAWLQHCYAHTAPGGRTVIVMPASTAYRKAGRRIRAELVRRGILVQVVALPGGVASSHSVPVLLWTLRRPKPDDAAPSHVRMIDLTGNEPDGPLEPIGEQIVDVPLIDLLDETVDLTPGHHVHRSAHDFRAEYQSLREQIEQQLHALGALLPALRVPYVSFSAFDVEREPGAQGLTTGEYDIVIANNVLHATEDIVRTVRHARALLRPGGVLVLNELARNDWWSHLTFGLLDGWWRFTDGRRIRGGPALSPDAWRDVLRECGFGTVEPLAEPARDLGQQVLLARAGSPVPRQDARREVRPAAAGSTEEHVRATVERILAETLRLTADELAADKPFADYGLDSLTG
ncbi:N-6 DNA methylase [Streptomyces rubiginosohelvolus]|uniref:N-6 DNA methylase n=1 Tax=Streptomyces rubiginosohelvolus TaxID=67362 RepID=UPI0033FEB7D2